MDVRFRCPANFYVSGKSQSGKTFLVRSMLQHMHKLFSPVPNKVIYCYSEYQDIFTEMQNEISNIVFVEGFPSNLYDLLDKDNSLVIIDDLMSECSKDQRMTDLVTRGSHHRGVSVIYLTQNLFPVGKESRTISLNSHYMIIFRNPRDSLGITTLARQMYPQNVNYVMDSFNDATSTPYGYLMLDLHQLTPEDFRLRTNILPGERQISYVIRI